MTINNRIKDKTGKAYGRLTVVGLDHMNKFKRSMWLCRCACGNDVVVDGINLTSGHTQSCGCLRREISSKRGRNNVGDKNHNWGKRGPETSQWGRRQELSSKWKGGKHQASHGYILVHNPRHPRSGCRGYVYEHVLVMETMLGRHLTDKEVVHHCNGDKTDNRPYNLRLFASHGEHVKFHFKLHHDGIRRTGRYAKMSEGSK